MAEFRVKNYKGLKEEMFSPGQFSCLVGENNAGKSTLLQAVDHALNMRIKLDKKLFYDESLPIEFSCYFEDVTEDDLNRLADNHKEKISNAIYEESKFSILVRANTEKGEVKVLKPIPKEAKYRKESLEIALKGKKPAEMKTVFETTYPEVSLPQKITKGNLISAVDTFVSNLSENEFEIGEVKLETGIKESIQALLPETIYIPAVKNLDDDVKASRGTSFSKIIELLLEDVKEDLEEFHKAMSDLNKKLNRTENEGGQLVDNRHEKVKEVESKIEEFLKENFPHVKVELEIPPPELKTIFSSAKIWVDDGSRDQIDNKGDGIKRSLIFALLQTYVEKLEEKRKKDNSVKNKTLIFLFEEPELYLHPRSQKILFSTLGSVAKDYQVVVTTHSPLFFAPGVTAEFTRVTKTPETPKPIGKLYSVDFNLNPDSSEAFKMATFEHAEAAFFSRKIVLFEGESDEFFLKHIAKTLNQSWDFELENISLVRCNGKGNFERFKKFFQCFDIHVFIIGDLDCIIGGFEKLMPSEEAISLRSEILQNIDNLIAEHKIEGRVNRNSIKKAIENRTWVETYQELKDSLRTNIGKSLTVEFVDKFNNLFDWEHANARLTAIAENEPSKLALMPLIKKLRNEDIFILQKGAVEDYYPDGVTNSKSKPEKAIQAIDLVSSADIAKSLSFTEEGTNNTELEQVFEKIFG